MSGLRTTYSAWITSSAISNPADPAWLTHQAELQRTLRAIADEGDGFAILGRDLATQLKRVADAMRK